MTSHIFKYHDTPLWEEFLDDDGPVLDFSKWLQLKIPKASSVRHLVSYRQCDTADTAVEIIFKEEKDLTFFLLTL